MQLRKINPRFRFVCKTGAPASALRDRLGAARSSTTKLCSKTAEAYSNQDATVSVKDFKKLYFVLVQYLFGLL